MATHWYLRYGWIENPFIVKPNSFLVGREEIKEKLINYIQSDTISVILGDVGTGKTSLLFWLKENAAKNAIYVDASQIKDEKSVYKILKKNRTFSDFIQRRKYPKDVVLLIDEAQLISTSMIQFLRRLWDNNIIKSMIVSYQNIDFSNLDEPFKHRFGDRIIKIEPLNSNDVIELINIRTTWSNTFTTDALEYIRHYSNSNPRKILENSEKVAMHATVTENISKEETERILTGM